MDIQINNASFDSTEITVAPVSEKGKVFFAEVFGNSVDSVNIPKSKAMDLEVFASRKGLSVN